MSSNEILEQNLRRLLRRSYSAAPCRPEFREALLEQLLDSVARAPSAVAWRHFTTVALAASVLLGAGFAAWSLVGSRDGNDPGAFHSMGAAAGGAVAKSGFTLRGRVKLDSGTNAGRYEISLAPKPATFSNGKLWKSVTLGPDGTFEFTGLQWRSGELFLNNASSGVEAVKLRDVEIPNVKGPELDLELPSGRVTGIVRAGAVSVPAGGAYVVLYAHAPASPDSQFMAVVLTKEDGKFSISYLTPGSYDIKVFAASDGAKCAEGLVHVVERETSTVELRVDR